MVWEFYNPHVKVSKKKRATIYRFMRLSESDLEKVPQLKKYLENKEAVGT